MESAHRQHCQNTGKKQKKNKKNDENFQPVNINEKKQLQMISRQLIISRAWVKWKKRPVNNDVSTKRRTEAWNKKKTTKNKMNKIPNNKKSKKYTKL